MNKYLIILLLITTQQAMAAALSLPEFKQQSKLHYAELEAKQADLNSALDQKLHPEILVEKACAYAHGLKVLKFFAKQNRHLVYAQEEYVFISELDEGFKQSLNDLGASYKTSCAKK